MERDYNIHIVVPEDATDDTDGTNETVEVQMQIDRDGCLWINRGRGIVVQYCPDSAEGNQCGDWCPKFGEPETGIDDEDNEAICLELCTCTWCVPVDAFKDLRG